MGFLRKQLNISMGFQEFCKELSNFHPFSILPLLLLLMFLHKHTKPSIIKRNTPPSPPKLPILGNFHQLGKLPHRSLRSLSQRYGELMLLHIGNKPTLVVSSANAAREILKTHDLVFSDRPKQSISSRLIYDCKDVTFSAYGEYWRQMRSICVLQLLSNKKVQSFRTIREEEAVVLVEKLKKSSSKVVNLSDIIMTLTNDVICMAAFGKKYTSDEEGKNFTKLVNDFMELLGIFSIRDIIPWLSWIERVNGLDSKVEKVAKGFDKLLEKVVREHQDRLNTMRSYSNDEADIGESMNNFVDVLLQIQEENKGALSTDAIKAIILDMFAAGTETIYTLLEWTMTELVRHPRAMQELQEEVRDIVKGKGRVTEDDLEKMNYLKAVVKETLRLYPPAPLLVFREASQDVKVYGYDIAAKTQVIVNAWAIHRDTAFWEESEKFRPERFLNSTIDYKGHDFHFIPFGAGRRGCPGISFAAVTAELALATLVYEFNWKMPVGAESETSYVPEIAGITVHRKHPLMLIATPYSCK